MLNAARTCRVLICETLCLYSYLIIHSLVPTEPNRPAHSEITGFHIARAPRQVLPPFLAQLRLVLLPLGIGPTFVEGEELEVFLWKSLREYRYVMNFAGKRCRWCEHRYSFCAAPHDVSARDCSRIEALRCSTETIVEYPLTSTASIQKQSGMSTRKKFTRAVHQLIDPARPVHTLVRHGIISARLR